MIQTRPRTRAFTGRLVAAVLMASALCAVTAASGLASPATAAAATSITVDVNLAKDYNKHTSALGKPVQPAATSTTTGMVTQQFSKGTMYFTPGYGVGWVTGTAKTLYDAAGGAATLGAPFLSEDCSAAGCRLWTTNGDVYRHGTTGQAVSFSNTVKLASVVEFRDVAGTGTGPAAGTGAVLARGQLYRAGSLAGISSHDKWLLRELGITDIYDLRTTASRKASPTPAISGIAVHAINITGDSFPVATWNTASTATASMVDRWSRYATDSTARANLAKLVREIASQDDPVLILDDDGLGVAAWASAALGMLVGESSAAATAGYLVPNQARTQAVATQAALYRTTKGAAWADGWRRTVTPSSSYLAAALSKVTGTWGTWAKYATTGLGLTSTQLDALRRRLTSSTTSGGQFRVTEANILYSLSDAKVIHDIELATADADVVGMMEVADNYLMLEEWARAHGWLHLQEPGVSHGRGLLVRRSALLAGQSNTGLVRAGTEQLYPRTQISARTLVWATVRLTGGQVVTVGATHAFYKIDGASAQQKNPDLVKGAKTQFAKLKAFATSKAALGDVILVGDLNVDYRKDKLTAREGYPWAVLESAGSTSTASLRSTWSLLGLPADSSQGTRGPNSARVIDYQYLWVGKGARLYATSQRLELGTRSDHYQLHTTYALGKARTAP